MENKRCIRLWATETSLRAEVDLTRYRSHCPVCAETDYEREVSEHLLGSYRNYRLQAQERFGLKSLPLCYVCYNGECATCEDCGMPMQIYICHEVGDDILYETTLVREDHRSDNLCVECSKHTNVDHD